MVSGGRESCNFIKKETLAQVFSCEFCEISKNTFLQRTPLVTTSANLDLNFHSEKRNRKEKYFKTCCGITLDIAVEPNIFFGLYLFVVFSMQ